jgi:hypothetical protein
MTWLVAWLMAWMVSWSVAQLVYGPRVSLSFQVLCRVLMLRWRTWPVRRGWSFL